MFGMQDPKDNGHSLQSFHNGVQNFILPWPSEEDAIIIPAFRWTNWGAGRLTNLPKAYHSSVGWPAMGSRQLSWVLIGGTEPPLWQLYSALCFHQSNVEIVQNGCHSVLTKNADTFACQHTSRVRKQTLWVAHNDCFSPPLCPPLLFVCPFPSQRSVTLRCNPSGALHLGFGDRLSINLLTWRGSWDVGGARQCAPH